MNKTKPLIECSPTWFAVDTVDAGNPLGVQFDCPICPANEHRLFVPWSHGDKSQKWRANHPLWEKTSEGFNFETLTLSPSIWYQSDPCNFHGYVTNGQVTW